MISDVQIPGPADADAGAGQGGGQREGGQGQQQGKHSSQVILHHGQCSTRLLIVLFWHGVKFFYYNFTEDLVFYVRFLEVEKFLAAQHTMRRNVRILFFNPTSSP